MFKTNLIEAVHRKRLEEDHKQTALGYILSRVSGFARRGDHLANNSGQTIHIGPHEGHGGYFHLFDNGKHTGIAHPEATTFSGMVKNWFSKKD